jgi:hypothetical protein
MFAPLAVPRVLGDLGTEINTLPPKSLSRPKGQTAFMRCRLPNKRWVIFNPDDLDYRLDQGWSLNCLRRAYAGRMRQAEVRPSQRYVGAETRLRGGCRDRPLVFATVLASLTLFEHSPCDAVRLDG